MGGACHIQTHALNRTSPFKACSVSSLIVERIQLCSLPQKGTSYPIPGKAGFKRLGDKGHSGGQPGQRDKLQFQLRESVLNACVLRGRENPGVMGGQ